MRKCLLVLGLAALILLPIGAQAQGEVRLSSVRVDIWPEYDRPAVLVIYYITLSAETKLPADLAFRIPAEATINAVAFQDTNGMLLNMPYEQQVQGEWVLLSFSTSSPDIQVEYYDPLSRDGKARHIVYQWPGDYAVDSFSVRFQHPVGATALQISPPPAESTVEQDGLSYYRLETMTLAAGQTFVMEVDYRKAKDELTASGLEVQPVAPLGDDTAGRVSLARVLPWVLGSMGGLLLVGGLVGALWYWRSSQMHQTVPRKRHAPRDQRETESGTGSAYCHECGRRAQPGDRFCRACGIRLRQGE